MVEKDIASKVTESDFQLDVWTDAYVWVDVKSSSTSTRRNNAKLHTRVEQDVARTIARSVQLPDVVVDV